MKAEMKHFWYHWLFVNMPFTKEDKILIKNLFELKVYTAKQLVREFPSKGWNVSSVYKLLQKLRVIGSVDHRPDSGRRRSSRTADNIDLASELVLSQEDKPQSHRTVREISRETGIHRLSVNRIIAGDTYVFQQDGALCSRDSSAIAAGDTTFHLPRSVVS